MATAAASTVSHQLPPITIPHVPRIRPPRMLKGTPSPNTDPQPSGPVPENRLWVQGQWRNPSSNAVKDRQHVQIRKIEKALRHQAHGMNIYAYNHIRTNQVVYSLTRVLNNTKVLRQLLYHGKKTVPEALRRDMWRPYFSIHFPQTLAGAQAGLQAYQQLRELSLQRQLAPPEELLMTNQEDINVARSKRGDPIDTKSMIESHSLKLPNLNQKLPKKLRARRLMDQKASSVADAAFVLALANDGLSPEAKLVEIERNRAERHKLRSQRARRRLRSIREKEEAKQKQLEGTADLVQHSEGNLSVLPLDKHAAIRISMEYQGVMENHIQVRNLETIEQTRAAIETSVSPKEKLEAERALEPKLKQLLQQTERRLRKEWEEKNQGQDPLPPLPSEDLDRALSEARIEFEDEHQSMDKELDESSREVKVLWADMRDGTYAESWPENVFHGELESRAMAKKSISVVMQEAIVDGEGHEIVEQRQTKSVPASSSVHVIGTELGSGWVPDQNDPKAQTERTQNSQTKLDEIEQRFMEVDQERDLMRSKLSNLIKIKEQTHREPAEDETLEEDIEEASHALEQLSAESKALVKEYKVVVKLGVIRTEEELDEKFGNRQADVEVGLPEFERKKTGGLERRRVDVQALRDAGIEVDDLEPRKGLWGRVRGWFGR